MPSRLRRRGFVVPAVVVLIAGGSAAAWASGGSAAPQYRTVTVTTGDVEQVLALTGTSTVVSQARASFPVSGTVSSVKVLVGDTVKAGQVLATVETTRLRAAVVTTAATLAKAKATLETDESASSTTSTSSASTSSASTPTASSTGAGPAAGGASSAAAQRATSRALAKASRDRAAAKTAFVRATTACAVAATTPIATPTSTVSSTATPVASCLAALAGSLAAQQRVAQDQTAVERDLQSAVASSARSATTAVSRVATAVTTSPSGLTGRSSGQGSGQSTQSTAARVTTDRAAIEAARVGLDTAQKTLAGASLTSPLTGTVATQPFAAGQSESTSDAITVMGTGAVAVTVDVPSVSLRSVKVGQHATVVADGATTPVSGTVTQIGLLPTSSTTGSGTTYPVTVLVAHPGKALVDGGAASVSIVITTVRNVVTVPNSALSNGSVAVLTAGKAVATRVGTGATGGLTTEVRSGLKAGQLVVLADLSRALPANSTTTTRFRFGGTGGPDGGFTGGANGGFTGGRAGGFAGRTG